MSVNEAGCQRIDKIIDEVAELLRERLFNKLEALILVGSFSRGEGFACNLRGRVSFLSDLEFLAVAKIKEFKYLSSQKPRIEEGIKENLKNIADAEVTLGVTTPRHLKKLKPYIFTVETKKHGKVLWGRKDILDLIPSCSEIDIEPEDGFILLNNRIVDQLILLKKIKKGLFISQYELIKGYLQIINSLLAFNKRYKTVYPAKKEEFIRLLSEEEELRKRLPFLVSQLEEIFNTLENPGGEVDPEEALEEWQKLRESFKEAWYYEARRVMGENGGFKEAAFKKFISPGGFKKRLREWARVILYRKSRLFRRGELIWGIFNSTPQFLTYKKAVSFYFGKEFDRFDSERIIELWSQIVK